MSDLDGYLIHRACREAPLVLVFDRENRADRPFAHAELFERIAARCDRSFSTIFLRDGRGSAYFRGVTGLGGTIAAVAEALRARMAELECSEVITFGEGLGGHAALVFGVLLGASRIVAIEPIAHLRVDELARYHDRRWEGALTEIPEPASVKEYDVLSLIGRIGFDGRAFVLVGTRRGNTHRDAVSLEVVHAHWLARSDRVVLCPFPDLPRGLLSGLSRRGDAECVLSRYLFHDGSTPDSLQASPRPEPVPVATQNKVSYKVNLSWYYERNEDGQDELDRRYVAVANPTAVISRKMNDRWRRWLVQNILLGAAHDQLVTTLSVRGYSEEACYREIRLILQNPYFQSALRLRNRLKKRDWLVTSYRKLRRLDPGSGGIDGRERLCRAEFLRDYSTRNRPVIITGMMDHWPALKSWDIESLRLRFADRQFEVQIGPNSDETATTEPGRQPCTLRPADHLANFENGAGLGQRWMMISNNARNHEGLSGLWADIAAVTEYVEEPEGEGRSLWLGPSGAIISLHYYLTNTLIALVMGSMRVKLTPSWDLPISHKIAKPPTTKGAHSTPMEPVRELYEPQVLERLLNPGEMLFLPVGWGLSVESLRTTAAVAVADLGRQGGSSGSSSPVFLEARDPW